MGPTNFPYPDPMHLELPTASFVAALLSVAPLPWHWRARTIPTISIAFWLFLSNIINGVNAVIWANTVRIVAPVWCDISTKIIIGANVALPASIFCLCIHLERVSSVRQPCTSAAQKRRRQYVDSLLCFGVPIIYMALHYIVQGHRFDIVEDFGCRASIFVSLASVFLIWVPVLFFSLGSFVLSALAFRNFWIRRISFARHLQSSNSALTPSRYFRLMAMSLVQMFWGLVLSIFNMCFTMKGGLRPWIDWANVHFDFSRIAQFPTLFIPKQDLFYTYLLWWSVPISSVLFFVFFAFGQDAMKEYRACYIWLRSKIYRRPAFLEKLSSKPISAGERHAISLPSLGKLGSKLGRNNSEATLPSPVTSCDPYTPYKWDPPVSPSSAFTSTTMCNAFSPSEPPSPFSKAKEHDSWTIPEYSTPMQPSP